MFCRLVALNIALLTAFSLSSCQEGSSLDIEEMKVSGIHPDSLIQWYLVEGAWNYHYLTQEYADWVQRGIKEDSSIALFWKAAALPFWKTDRTDRALAYYDRAVELEPQKYLGRRAFLKCIYAKDYKGTIQDVDAFTRQYGEDYENDHSLQFYKALAQLQLGLFQESYATLKTNMDFERSQYGEISIHFLDYFYLGVVHYELKEYEAAIEAFDKVFEEYDDFSDAQFYKSLCLSKLNKMNEAQELMEEGRENYLKGYTFNEDSSIYVRYPYQIDWEWDICMDLLVK